MKFQWLKCCGCQNSIILSFRRRKEKLLPVKLEKRVPAAKKLIIPAKYILNCIANDCNTIYPIEVCVLSPNGGGFYQLVSKKEVIQICMVREIYMSSLVRISRKTGHYQIDLRESGQIEVEYDFMPERRHMETLVRTEAFRFYTLYFQK